MKKGLVMEGGAMRGMFTCGVMDVLMENDIVFDGAAGISAGATFGCNFKSRQIGRPLRYNLKYCRDPRYCSLRSLIFTGDLYGADFCYRVLPDELDIFDREAYRQNPMDFYVGATEVTKAEIAYRNCLKADDTEMQWIRASASMPFVSRAVEIEGKKYLDGGIVDAVPYGIMVKNGYEKLVLILTQPAGYRKSPMGLKRLTKLLLRKYPALYEALLRRHEMYNRQMDEIDAREKSGQWLVMRPPEKLGVNRVEKHPDRLEKAYLVGKSEANARLEQIKTYLCS